MSLAFVVRPADRFADDVASTLLDRVATRPSLRLCLPTGSTPAPAYAAAAARGLDLSEATVVLLDEFGGLPPGDPARCDVAIERDLLGRLPRRPAAYVRLDPDVDDVDAEVARFDAEVAAGGLDLVLLGLGANGHLGLNEPGSEVTAPTRRVALDQGTASGALTYGASTAPSWGMTLGMDRIMAAREVWLLVTGEHKAAVLREVLTGPIGASVPASWLRQHPSVTVVADQPAASALDGSPLPGARSRAHAPASW